MHENKYINKHFLSSKTVTIKDKIVAFTSDIILKIPKVNNYYMKSFDNICTYLSTLIKQNELEKFYTVTTKCLENEHYLKSEQQEQWWTFMRIAIACLQQEQLVKFLIRPNVEDNLMLLGENYKNNRDGYDASYCYVGLSLWAFERGLTNKAIDFAKEAQKSYSEWGYPDYLVGWFGLFNKKVDSVDYFCKAIEKDWAMLHRIRQDPTCQMFPEVVKEVSKKVLVAVNNSDSNR